MEFFNKYKSLFGVPEGTPLPQKKISINNSLFIDKPFIPTYTESYSINSKLKALKKDYEDLDNQISQIQGPAKRSGSRRGKQKLGNSDSQRFEGNQKINYQNSPSLGGEKINIKKDPLAKKKASWLFDEQKDINKHSEIDYIFNQKIKQGLPKAQNLFQSRVPKAENFMFGAQIKNNNPTNFRQQQKYDQRSPNQDITNNRSDLQKNKERNQSQISLGAISNTNDNTNKRPNNRQPNNGSSAAQQRRNEAKRNIQTRREKLGYLLRTSW